MVRNLQKRLAPIMMRKVMAKVWMVVHIALLNIFQKVFQSCSLRRNMLIAMMIMARNAPMAADWLTEKTPENMPPSTTPKRITTPMPQVANMRPKSASVL